MERGWWKLECTIEPDEVSLEHIAKLIVEGYTSGEIINHEESED